MAIPTRNLADIDLVRREPLSVYFDSNDANPVVRIIDASGLGLGLALNLASLFDDNGKVDLDNALASGDVPAKNIADAILTALKVATVADVNVAGGIPVVHRTTVPAGANGDVDITVDHKVRVIDAWAFLKGAGTAGSLLTLKNGATAISNAVDVAAGGDKDRFGVGEVDDAQHEIAAAGTLRWSKASTGGDFPGAECYVLGVRVA